MIGLGSASSLGIGLAVWMDDQFSQTANRFNSSLSKMGKSTNDYIDGIQRLERLGMGIASIGDKILGAGMKDYRAFAKFDNITNSTRAIIGNLKTSDPLYSTMVAQTMDLGDKWGIVANQVAEAQREIAKAGRDAKDTIGMTEATMLLGRSAEIAVGGDKGAAVMLSDIMNTYSLGVDSAVKVTDLLTSAANRSTLSVTDFYESIKYSGDIAKQFNIPIEETSAVLAALGNSGLKGSMAGTGYANMVRYLGKAVTPFATKKQTSALKMLGIDKGDLLTAQGELKGITDILSIFEEKSKGLSGPMRAGIFGDIFGVRGNRPFENLLSNRGENGQLAVLNMMAKLKEDLGTGVTEDVANEKMLSAMAPIERMEARIANMKLMIGKALVPVIEPFVIWLGKAASFLREFAQSDIGKWVIRLGFILGGVGMAFIGRLLFVGARFMMFIMTSAGRLTNAFQIGQLAGRSINQQLTMASDRFVQNMLRARGIMAYTNAAGMPMYMGRGANGRFTGGVARTALSTGLGTMFGRRGLAWAASLTKFFGPVTRMFGWITKIGPIFGMLFKALGFLGRIFFSWWFIIADLLSVLITGKSLFEWLWEGLKWLGTNIFGMKFASDEADAKAKLSDTNNAKYYATTDYDRDYKVKQGLSMMNGDNRKASERPLHLTINNPGEGKFEKKYNLNQERDLNSINIE